MQDKSFDHNLLTDRKIIPLVLLFGIISDSSGMLFYQTVILRPEFFISWFTGFFFRFRVEGTKKINKKALKMTS